jgi:hypothetical protein
MTPQALHPRSPTSTLPKKTSLMPPLAFGSHMMTNNRATHADWYSGMIPPYFLAFRRRTLTNYFKPLGQQCYNASMQCQDMKVWQQSWTA